MPPKKATAKASKSTRKPAKTVRETKKERVAKTIEAPVLEKKSETITGTSFLKRKLNVRRVLVVLLVLLVAILAVYKYAPWLVPAWVDNKPITRMQLYRRLENTYGQQTMEDLINEQILDKAIADSGVQVPQEKVDAEIQKVEDQFQSLGGLDAALEARGMTRDELVKQIHTQLAVEEILKDQIQPTEEEIVAEYEEGKATVYQGKTLEESRESITVQVKQAKLRDAFLAWFAEKKQGANVRNFYTL